MSEPRIVRLASVTAWSSGGTPNRANPAYWGGTIPWISAATLKSSWISSSDQNITETALRAESKLAPAGTTLILVRGMALHREARIGLAQRPVSFNQDVKALTPKPGVIPEFLMFSLQARSAQILQLVSSAGSGTGVLDTQLLKRLPIWVPDQSEQLAVVAAVSDAEASISTLEHLIAKKQAIKQGMRLRPIVGVNGGGLGSWLVMLVGLPTEPGRCPFRAGLPSPWTDVLSVT
jgi:type I restriction enzyme S subunit